MTIKNKKLLNLITSTGLIIIPDKKENVFLFYDNFAGFYKEVDSEDCFFYNNLHRTLSNEKRLKVYQFFYYYPMIKSQLSMSGFFREFLENLNSIDFEENVFTSFIWEVGELVLHDKEISVLDNLDIRR